ncbi:MAG: hypothetical protein K8R31_04310, partial [Bacteroidales bacterium]|nr:hypothetical protein [Bacteroidales bacterium]
MKKHFYLLLVFVLIAVTSQAQEMTQKQKNEAMILITNVNIFDGKSETLNEGMSVLIEGNKIAQIAKSIKAPQGAHVIDANGRTMT